jgi:hypothetical protein
VLVLLHGAFLAAGLLLGASLWWVTRRLFGNTGGFIALALYCFSPQVVHASTYPNNEILAALGLFASVYTGVGVAHAMQGPRRKWPSRILLLVVVLGLTAAAHVSAFLLALVLVLAGMGYLAQGRRAALIPVMMVVVPGSLLLVFASYAFSPDAFSYYFRSSAGRMWLSPAAASSWLFNLPNAGITIAALAALGLYCLLRPARYFGNTLPLIIAVPLLFLITPGVASEPSLWALPFVLAFIAGVFADILETRHRRLFFWTAGSILVLQAVLCLLSLHTLVS